MSEESVKKAEPAAITRHWWKVGVELEGGWDKPPQQVAELCKGAKVMQDNSVGGTAALFHGEVITRPHDNIEELLADIHRMYPAYVNDSCGFHIHVSFSPMDTSCLADVAFWHYFQRRWEAWATKMNAGDEFWRRFQGKPTGPRKKVYCKPEWKAASQLKTHDRELRYTAVNFVSYHQYKTVECRILPMFADRTLMEASLKELLSIYDTYLSTTGWNTISEEWKVHVDMDGVKEVYSEDMPDRRVMTHREETEHPHLTVGKDVSYTFASAPEAIAYMRPFREEVDTEINL